MINILLPPKQLSIKKIRAPGKVHVRVWTWDMYFLFCLEGLREYVNISLFIEYQHVSLQRIKAITFLVRSDFGEVSIMWLNLPNCCMPISTIFVCF